MNFKGKGGEYENPELGAFSAICYKVIDLGTQDVVWQGSKKRQHKALISWELSQKMKDGRPFAISKKYTVSLAENAALRKDLEAWRGKKFSQEELDTFTEKSILSKPCLLTLVSSKDGQYVNVGNVTVLPAGMPVSPQINPNVFLSLQKEEFDQKVFDGLSDKLKAQIMLSPEWHELKGTKLNSHEDAPSEEEVNF